MPEVIDVYSDQFSIGLGPYGANLMFALTPAHQDVTSPKPPEQLATIRMSIEHLKVMAILITRQVKKMESDLGVTYKIPSQILNSLGFAPEDWDLFWSSK